MWLQMLRFAHVMSYGILLGSQFFQTFLNGILAFRSLDRPSFGVHQAAIFPVYFSLQSIFPVFVAGTRTQKINSNNPHSGVVEVYQYMAIVSLTGLINLIIFRPLTQNVVKGRKHQEMKDRRTSSTVVSRAKKDLDRRFLYIHGISICINIGGLLATIQYGIRLGKSRVELRCDGKTGNESHLGGSTTSTISTTRIIVRNLTLYLTIQRLNEVFVPLGSKDRTNAAITDETAFVKHQ